MRSTASLLRLTRLGWASGLALFFLAYGLAQIASNWSPSVDLGTAINTTSAEQ